MRIKDFLNEFEADRAALPGVEKETLAKLRNKTIVISGGELARCLCYAFLYNNEAKRLGIKVILLGKSRNAMASYHSELMLRDDFDFVDYNSASEISSADYVITTGICGEHTDNNPQIMIDGIAEINACAKIAKATGARVVVVNDSRIYGKVKPHRVYSENEYAELDATSPSSLAGQLMRTRETTLHSVLKNSESTVTTLRTGIILGASSNFTSVLDPVFDDIANRRDTVVPATRDRYTFVYINDVLKAIVFAMTNLEENAVYNVGGKNCNASLIMIAAVLNDIYGSRCTIESGDFTELDGCAINSNKISVNECTPDIDLETMLKICIMDKMKSEKVLRIPHSHERRLDSIHEIQLAFLLETDRICRKHNIKYFLGGGTLLGAIRHKGFIPWDDDADIMMLREDFDRFCEIAPKELPSNMTFQSYHTDKACFYEFAKVRLDDTFFATDFAKDHHAMHNGIAFDIFCHDNTANSAIGRKIHMAVTLFTRALVFNKWNNRKAENGSRIQSIVTNFCKKIFPLRFSMWLEVRTLKFFKNKKNAKYLYDGMGRNIYNGAFPKEYLDDVAYADFEGYKFPVPKKYDKYLTFLYGDYMELAPLSTRMGCHEIALCDIGKYDGFKIRKPDSEK